MNPEQCHCPCHGRGLLAKMFPPELIDPVESLVACTLCTPLHAGVWQVVPRGYVDPLDRPDSGEGDET